MLMSFKNVWMFILICKREVIFRTPHFKFCFLVIFLLSVSSAFQMNLDLCWGMKNEINFARNVKRVYLTHFVILFCDAVFYCLLFIIFRTYFIPWYYYKSFFLHQNEWLTSLLNLIPALYYLFITCKNFFDIILIYFCYIVMIRRTMSPICLSTARSQCIQR